MKNAICILVILAAIPCRARTITVDDNAPADFNNIQAAIDDANDGDTVLVADGIYTGDGNRDIDFHGKAITVKSESGPENCIIDCQASWEEPHRGFYFTSGGEATDSIVEGFTITNGNVKGATWPHGGAIFFGEGSATIMNNIITNNQAYFGGGIYCDCSYSIIKGNIITQNRPYVGGGIACVAASPIIEDNIISESYTDEAGAIYCRWSWPIIKYNVLVENWSEDIAACILCEDSWPMITGNIIVKNWCDDGAGGGITCFRGSATITNNTISGNYAYTLGSAMFIIDCEAQIRNNIVWGNNYDIGQIFTTGSTAIVTYNDVEHGYEGLGNIIADPCFIDPPDNDYHLKSQAGRWDANEGRWMRDDVTSLCIDAGDPMTPVGLEPFPNGGRINMGAYGGTSEASKSYFGKPPCETIVAGDINGDCEINFEDFRLMALHWCEDNNP